MFSQYEFYKWTETNEFIYKNEEKASSIKNTSDNDEN